MADVLTEYLLLISEFAKDSPDGDTRLYHRPRANGKDGIPRFSHQVVARHTLQTYVKLIAKKGGLQGSFTSHSLKACLAMQLYSERVDEQLCKERTGVEALRKNKRTSAELQVGVLKLLQGGAEAPATKRPSHGGKIFSLFLKMHSRELLIALSISSFEMSKPLFSIFRVRCPLHICVLYAFSSFIGLVFFVISSTYTV